MDGISTMRVCKDGSIMWNGVKYVPERTCGLRSRFTGMYCYECSECRSGMKHDWSFCPTCGAKVISEV